MPPKKKGTSAEEKRRMLQAKVMESASFFNAKELEKMAATVGISGMSFKAELQTMLDEDMLVVDKVGAGNYYWKLPGDAANAIAKKKKDAEAMEKTLSRRADELRETIKRKREAAEGDEDRDAVLNNLARLEEIVSKKRKELEVYADSDPALLTRLKEASKLGYEGAVRWTDNVWCLESWMKKQFEGRETELKAFMKENGYKDDFDYPSMPKALS